jgi:hypothetical protein
MIGGLQIVDHSVLIWNLLLLMCVGVLPFATAPMAAYLKGSEGEALAAAVYSGSFMVMTLVFDHHVLVRRAGLLDDEVDEKTRHLTLKRGADLAGRLNNLPDWLRHWRCHCRRDITMAHPFALVIDGPPLAVAINSRLRIVLEPALGLFVGGLTEALTQRRRLEESAAVLVPALTLAELHHRPSLLPRRKFRAAVSPLFPLALQLLVTFGFAPFLRFQAPALAVGVRALRHLDLVCQF